MFSGSCLLVSGLGFSGRLRWDLLGTTFGLWLNTFLISLATRGNQSWSRDQHWDRDSWIVELWAWEMVTAGRPSHKPSLTRQLALWRFGLVITMDFGCETGHGMHFLRANTTTSSIESAAARVGKCWHFRRLVGSERFCEPEGQSRWSLSWFVFGNYILLQVFFCFPDGRDQDEKIHGNLLGTEEKLYSFCSTFIRFKPIRSFSFWYSSKSFF